MITFKVLKEFIISSFTSSFWRDYIPENSDGKFFTVTFSTHSCSQGKGNIISSIYKHNLFLSDSLVDLKDHLPDDSKVIPQTLSSFTLISRFQGVLWFITYGSVILSA